MIVYLKPSSSNEGFLKMKYNLFLLVVISASKFDLS